MAVIDKKSLDRIVALDIFDFVDEAYNVILGRTPDISGYKAIVKEFSKGRTKEELLLSLINSDEAVNKHVEVDPEWKKSIASFGHGIRKKNNNIDELSEAVSKEIFNIKNLEKRIIALEQTENINAYKAIDYFDFENRFRGSREHIKNVQRIYLEYFKGCKNVLDLGAGRGEFTELLKDEGIGVLGIDTYEPYVEYMKNLGLPAMHGDAVDYLKEQNSIDGIFLGQVVEHISVEQIIEICELAHDKLEDGRYLIMETPNPRSLAIFTNAFYLDPSHKKPVHPFTLKYLAEKAGFKDVSILYTETSRVKKKIPKICEGNPDYKEFNEAMSHVSELLYGSQDYAVIAKK